MLNGKGCLGQYVLVPQNDPDHAVYPLPRTEEEKVAARPFNGCRA